jgi:hypothetical protein
VDSDERIDGVGTTVRAATNNSNNPTIDIVNRGNSETKT